MVESEIRKTSSIINPLSQSFQRAIEKEKQATYLKYQKENYSAWRKNELKYLGKFLMVQNFQQNDPEHWKIADFSVKGEYDLTCGVNSEWKPLEKVGSSKGLEIANKILMPVCKIHLNSLACDIKIRVKLIGDSSLFIVSRTSSTIEASAPVLKITNDTSLKGLFAMFGCVDPSNLRYNYSKQVQIPEDIEEQPPEKNYKELEIKFCDNGDNRVYLTIMSCGKYRPIKQFATFCDSFIPLFESSKVLIGGCGDSVIMKYAHLQQRERNVNKVPERNPECCCVII